ncbi:CPBP family intramembrane metalloprotease [Dactylosporangium aurantiacum]|uniref:CPBP family intramembrane metalloprotease n=1 Tax=Dactylosporangium aurantiacum TaxID=35754 RepID=A0A9Q9IDW1_9ACTN|nr:CPBP family intramembrane glutamic endopeptidase [Dactylosporangium aurantiacum]MDG6107089.1 CPBP family intramembrane metalloprotease [Dactylosporangium aurantiacum]UWZ51388.1 CPBP family intramembrane metalloprotease [Dactylosporangium aurantiacum]
MRLLKQLAAVAAVAFAGSLAVGAARWNVPLTLVLGVATAVLSLLAYAWVVRRTERRAPVEVAARGAGPKLGRGVLVGFAMFAAVVAAIAVTGGYRVHGWGSAGGAVALVGFMAAAAVTEELLFRGVLFRIVEERLGTWGALLLTAPLFGLAHLPNPNATLWSALAVAVEAGALLAAVYAATRNLWVPIGVHFGWNFAGGGVFGTDVSGKDAPQGLLDGVTSGPAVLSGGGFGPEGSVWALLAGVALTAVFLRLARRRGTMVPRRGRTAPADPAATLAP